MLNSLAQLPGRRAADLATGHGVDTVLFKRCVRNLKALGLTESLEVGYRISPRGEAFLSGDATSGDDGEDDDDRRSMA